MWAYSCILYSVGYSFSKRKLPNNILSGIPMSDIEALQREIRAIDFALESYVDFEEEEVARRRHLKENFDSFPGLKRYVLCSASALQDEKKQLRDEIKLLLEKDKAIIEKDKAIIEKEKLIQEEKVILLRREEAHTQPTGRLHF